MTDREYKIIGYIAGWKDWTAENIDTSKLTHINYAFAQITNGKISYSDKNKLNEIRNLKRKAPEVKILISVGGWGAEGFSDAALTAAARCRFCDSAVEFIKEYGFDGVDLDWEYPCSSEAGIKAVKDDRHNFTLLLQAMREKLDYAGVKSGKEYLLTIAAGAMPEQIKNLELLEISNTVDFINVMAYDFHNGLSSFSGHQSNLYTSICDDGDRMSIDNAVQSFLQAGMPSSKVILGIPFYGRGWSVNEADNNGLYEFAESKCEEYSFGSLINGYISKNGFERYWDQSAKAGYLWNGRTFISYEDEVSLGFKTAYIKKNSLGGAMFWEYMLDESGILLSKLYDELK